MAGRLERCFPGCSEPDSRVCLMECPQGAMVEGTSGVKNGKEWELKERDQSLGRKLRGHSISSGEFK